MRGALQHHTFGSLIYFISILKELPIKRELIPKGGIKHYKGNKNIENEYVPRNFSYHFSILHASRDF